MTDLEKIAAYENVLDEVAHGAPWGGPLKDHMRFLQHLAHKVLVKTGVEEPDEAFGDKHEH